MHLQTPNMSLRVEYSSYINIKSIIEFILCISDYIKEVHAKKMLDSPFFFVMLDESIDNGLRQHLTTCREFYVYKL
jgi:hypothetical protein